LSSRLEWCKADKINHFPWLNVSNMEDYVNDPSLIPNVDKSRTFSWTSFNRLPTTSCWCFTANSAKPTALSVKR
jgi:hypothetical protein